MRFALLMLAACSGNVQSPVDGSASDATVDAYDASGATKCPPSLDTCAKEGAMCLVESACPMGPGGNLTCTCVGSKWQCTGSKCDAGTD